MPGPACVSRFAPSPTGRLHLGHAFSALLAHDLARRSGGQFVLRIEDIDRGRCREPFVSGILADLAWLGLGWDRLERQAQGAARHEAALARLEAMGLAYPCFCTRADIAAAAGAPHGAPVIYPGTCRGLPPAEARARAAAMPHAVRLDVARAAAIAGPLAWHDAGAGTVRAQPEMLGDIVLARRDFGVGYMLASAVDDAEAGVTDVVRGRDLFAATHVQRLLQALLGLATPRYHHHRLLLAADGRRLAKRDRAETLEVLRARGLAGAAVAARLRGIPALGPDCHIAFT